MFLNNYYAVIGRKWSVLHAIFAPAWNKNSYYAFIQRFWSGSKIIFWTFFSIYLQKETHILTNKEHLEHKVSEDRPKQKCPFWTCWPFFTFLCRPLSVAKGHQHIWTELKVGFQELNWKYVLWYENRGFVRAKTLTSAWGSWTKSF